MERDAQPDRLTRLETALEKESQISAEFRTDVRTFIRSRSGFNWQIVTSLLAGVGIVAALVVPLIAGVIAYFTQAIDAQKNHSDNIESRLTRWIESEQSRNNRLEREMGAAEMIDRLFMAGRLDLGPAKKE